MVTLALPVVVSAQEEINFTADRPGMGTGTGIQSKGKVIWEYGMSFDHSKGEGGLDGTNSFMFANSLFRYGISNSVELRLELDGMHESCGEDKSTGLAPIIIGTKVRFYEGEGLTPSVAMLANLTLPVASKAFRPSNFAPSIYLLADHDVTDKINLTYNAGLEWDGEQAAPTTFTALCVGYSINDRLGCYIENYDYFHKGEKPLWNMDLGVNYMLNDRVQLDLAGSCNLNGFKTYGVSLGVAWLIN